MEDLGYYSLLRVLRSEIERLMLELWAGERVVSFYYYLTTKI